MIELFEAVQSRDLLALIQVYAEGVELMEPLPEVGPVSPPSWWIYAHNLNPRVRLYQKNIYPFTSIGMYSWRLFSISEISVFTQMQQQTCQ